MNWLQLAYQYGIGGLFFAISLWLCFRFGAAQPGNHSDRRTFHTCLLGFVGYLVFHGTWILLAS